VVTTFLLSILGTFITRSGIIQSVHSFAQSNVGGWFAAFLVLATVATGWLVSVRLKDLEAMETSGEFEGRTKKEVLLLTREKDKLAKTLGGIRDMAKVPSAVWIVDTKKEHIAVGEARKLNIPVVAVLDTNCDPDEVDYPVPGNDDAIRSAALLTKVIAEAVAAGLLARSGGAAVAAGEEPLAEWERELLASGAEASAVEPFVADAPITDVQAETDAGAAAVNEVKVDAAEGVTEVVPNEQASVVGADLN
jgi:small subunit ribosomal protein S2